MLLIQPTPSKQAPLPPWAKYLVATVVILLITSLILKFLTPKKAEVQSLMQTNFDGTQSAFEKVSFVGVAPQIPNQLPTAIATPANINSSEVIQNLAQTYNLVETTSQTENSWEWENDVYKLIFIESQNQVSLGSNVPLKTRDTTTSALPTTDSSVMAAKEIISQAGLSNYLEDFSSQVEFLMSEGGGEGVTTDAQSANFIRVIFSQSIAGYPLVFESGSKSVATVLLDTNYDLIGFEINLGVVNLQRQNNFQTITINQALSQINRGQASIVHSLYLGFGTNSLQKIARATLNEVNVEYWLDPNINSAVPYYRFSGLLINDSGQEFEGSIITPAIHTNF